MLNQFEHLLTEWAFYSSPKENLKNVKMYFFSNNIDFNFQLNNN